MKLRHLQFRADAKALAFAFSDPRFFTCPGLDPSSLWSSVKPPPGFDLERVPWAKHLEWAQQMFHAKGPLASLRYWAKELLENSGQWMSLRPVAATHEGISVARIRALAYDLWGTRKQQKNDDWTDWFSAIELLDSQPGDEILRWRWMSLALPVSLFVGAGVPQSSVPPRAVRLLDSSIVPSTPVALLHAHLGAMSSFEAMWGKLGKRIISTRQSDGRLRKDENPLGEGNGTLWAESLRQAFIVREILFRHAGHSSSLGKCSLCDLPGDVRNIVWSFANAPRDTPTMTRQLQPPDWEGERREECFLQRALAHAEREEGQYEVLLTQYIRVKVLLFRYVVADPDQPGLTAFVQTSGRSTPYQTYPTSSELEDEVTREIGLDVRSGELRTNLRSWMENHIGKAPFRDGSIESGWVLHFQRTSGATADPARKEKTIREASRDRLLDATNLARVIRINPHSLHHLRGLDVAALEREGPLWGFVRYLKMVRDVSKNAAAACPGLFPLRLTLHVGEDFDHLLSGLRAVHEPFAWRLMERGDRLGHAIPLGIDPEQWVKWTSRRAPVLKMRPWDRLLDIGWIQYALRVLLRGADEDQLDRLSGEAMDLISRLNWTRGFSGDLLSKANVSTPGRNRVNPPA